MSLTECADLREAEDLLSQELRSKTLIGEILLDAEDVRWLGDNLSRHLDVPSIWHSYPACAACFSVGTFAHYYEHGQYWPPFRRLFCDLGPNSENSWREEFEYFLYIWDMPKFFHVPGQRYLRHVRIHALIPRSAVNRVFEHVVQPAVGRGLDDDEWTAQDILELLQVDKFALHRPEGDFLCHGAHVADDFLRRCMALYRLAASGTQLSDDFGLPAWFVEAFQEWLQGKGVQIPAFERAMRSRAYLRLALESEAIVLVLGEPPYTTGTPVNVTVRAEGGGNASTEINSQNYETDPYVRQTEVGDDLKIKEVARRYTVTWRNLETNGEIEANSLRGFLEGKSLRWAAFSDTDSDFPLIREQQIPRAKVWIVCPKDATLQGSAGEEPQALEVIEKVPLENPPDMVACLVDASRLQTLVLRCGDAEDAEYVQVEDVPYIELPGKLPGVLANGYPVYSQLPRINVVGDSSRVVVEVTELGDAGMGQAVSVVPAAQLGEHLRDRAGAFELRTRERLGRRGKPVTLFLVPGLSVSFTPEVVLPDYKGDIAVRIESNHLSFGCAADPEAGVLKTEDGAIYLEPDARHLKLSAVYSPPGGAQSQFSLSLTVPRLLVGTDVAVIEEKGVLPAVARISRERIKQVARASLELVLQPPPTRWQVTLRAQPADWMMTVPHTRPSRGPRITAALESWRDSIIEEQQAQQLYADIFVDECRKLSDVLVAKIVSTSRLLKAEGKSKSLAGQDAVITYSFNRAGPAADLLLVHACFPWLEPHRVSTAGKHKGEKPISGYPPGRYLIQAATQGAETADILPDIDRGLKLQILGNAACPPGYEQLLRKIAACWDGVWQILENERCQLQEDKADRAEHEMREWIKREAAAQIQRMRLTKADLDNTLILMLYWGKMALRCTDTVLSRQYWECAVMLTIRVLNHQHHVQHYDLRNLLLRRLTALAQRASAETSELCRRFKGVLLRVFEKA